MQVELKIATLVAILLAAPALRAEDAPKPHKTDWLYQAKWGIMFHYCSNMKGIKDPAEWNKTIDAFDVKGLAKQLSENGVGYLLIVSKHCGFPNAPSAPWEAKFPGQAPKRDLIMDLADELAKYDIKLMLYFATGMGLPDGKQPAPAWCKFSASIIEEWSKRYGTKVKGWWFDNNIGNQEYQKILADAARSGNPDTLVAFSPPHNPKRNSPQDDYTAGNCHAPGMSACKGRFLSGCQWHMLSHIGRGWGGQWPTPRWPIDKPLGFTKGILARGGCVTWDTPHSLTGLVLPEYLPYLKAFSDAAKAVDRKPVAAEPAKSEKGG